MNILFDHSFLKLYENIIDNNDNNNYNYNNNNNFNKYFWKKWIFNFFITNEYLKLIKS